MDFGGTLEERNMRGYSEERAAGLRSALGRVLIRRFWSVLLILGVSMSMGCASMQTLEELERQAEITGDWTAVHERERILARREARRPPACPSGLVSYCETYVGTTRCTCVGRDAVQAVFVPR